MGLITGQVNTFNCPNYVGELFGLTPYDTPFLSMIGGLSGGQKASSKAFSWQKTDLRAAAQNTALEGANAPTASGRARGEIGNVCQIHQEAVDVSYTKLAAIGQNDGTFGNTGVNPVANEATFQLTERLKEIGRDIEYSFINGTYVNPADNNTTRKTRGILQAIVTNVIANTPSTAFTEKMLLDLMQKIWDNGGIKEAGFATVLCNSYQKRCITKAFITDKAYAEASRNVAGVNVQTIETDFGKINVVLDRYMPTSQIAVVSTEMCAPVFLEVPGKGFLFSEPLAKTGSSDKSQIYGEIGLKYGNELAHGKITGLTVVNPGS